MKTKRNLFVGLLTLALLLTLSVGLSAAQEGAAGDSPREPNAPPPGVSNYIPIQGRLTDSSGNPLNGVYSVTFRLYDDSTGGTALCEDVNTVYVDNGLFATYMKGTGCSIDGRQLYLGVQVAGDPEMTPRKVVDNVPYAWSLRPGAHIAGAVTDSPYAALHVWNTAASGSAYGVKGGTSSPLGRGLYGQALNGGVGVYGSSDSGAAFRAGGTGVIQSSALSYLWISGNDVHPFHQSDSTIIDMTNNGGAVIYRGAVAGYKNVMLPITIPGQLFGQDITVTGLDIYWMGDTDMEALTTIILRRQTGVCGASNCYATILHDTADHTCFEDDNPTGCVLHFDLTTNNVVSSDSGILYLTIEMGFTSPSTWIKLGGVRLTLEHD